MRVVLRADAGIEQGTGHIMRCLTLAAELFRRGHEVHLLSAEIPVPWLRDVVARSGVDHHLCGRDDFPVDMLRSMQPDWVVVDSYRIPASSISEAGDHFSVLAIVDGDDRGIEALMYLDQNLGAEEVPRNDRLSSRFLAGARFALIRDAVLDARRASPWEFRGNVPHLLCFMGGTDPSGSIVETVASLGEVGASFSLTVVAPQMHHEAVIEVAPAGRSLNLVAPTPALPALLADADVVVSAAGTSAWDLCALGAPAVLVAVVENQRDSLRAAVDKGLALGVNAIDRASTLRTSVGPGVSALLDDSVLRKQLSLRSRAIFDGKGASRVVSEMEERH